MFRKSSSGILEVDVISRIFRKVFSWNVPEVLSCLPRSIRKTGNRVLRGRFRCAMVRFFATKYKIANETLTSWPVNGPKSKNTCHEVLGSLERVFLERSGMCFQECSGSVLLFATKSTVTGNCVLRGRFRCAMVRFFATKYKIANETLTSWQRRKFCSVFYKKQTNLLLGIMLPDVCKTDFCNYPLKFSFNGYLFETLWS